jgi:hypothetical protein
MISATNVTDSIATADADAAGELGVGASLALNIGFQETHAEIMSGAAVTGANNITLTADGDYTMTTTAEAGAEGGQAISPAVAFAYTDNDTAALVGTGTLLDITGALLVEAIHVAETTTTARGASVGTELPVGAAVGINVVNDTARASTARDIDADGSVTFNATLTTDSLVNVVAGSEGVPVPMPGDPQDVDEEIARQMAYGDPNAGTSEETEAPSVVDTVVAQATDNKVSLPDVGVAAAVGVNVAFVKAEASIADSVTVTSGDTLTVGTYTDADVSTAASAVAVTSTTAVGAAIAVNYADVDNLAWIGESANVTANDIAIEAKMIASQTNNFGAGAIAGSGAEQSGFAGSLALNLVTNTTDARVKGDADVESSTDMDVIAGSDIAIITAAGGGAEGEDLGVGAALGINAVVNLTQAAVGEASDVDSGQTQVDVLGQLTIQATANEEINTAVAGGASADTVAIAGSIAINGLVSTTRAFIETDAMINQDGALIPDPAQAIDLLAQSDTAVLSLVGIGVSSDIVGGGAGFDLGAIVKETNAYLGGTADVAGNITISALSTEDIASVVAAAAIADGATIAGAGSIYFLNAQTFASISPEADVFADGNIAIGADDASQLDLNAGSMDAALGASAGASIAAPIVTKTTEAFIGNGAAVTANANGLGMDVKNGKFFIDYETDTTETGEIAAPDYLDVVGILADVFDFELFGYDLDYLTDVEAFSTDDSINEQRIAEVDTDKLFNGLAVTAVSRDDIETTASQVSAALGLGISLSAAGGVIQNTTRSYIDDSAVINADSLDADHEQRVLVAAGSDSYYMGITDSASAGIAAVGPALQLGFISNTTDAHIGASANVHAENEVKVAAYANEDVLVVAGGVAGSALLGVSASVPVVSIETHTHAFIDGIVNSDGNVMVYAEDITDVDIYSGNFSVSTGLGVGASLGIALIAKDTQAYIGDGAVVNAKGDYELGVPVFGSDVDRETGFSSDNIKGIAVQAYSEEQVVNLAGASALSTGLAITGAFAADIVEVDTRAYIGNADINSDRVIDPNTAVNGTDNTINLGSHGLVTGDAVVYRNGGAASIGINGGGTLGNGTTYYVSIDSSDPTKVRLHTTKTDAENGTNAITLDDYATAGTTHRFELDANASQSVNVSAADEARVFGVALTLQVGTGITGTFGGDLGFIRNDTLAYIGSGADVKAMKDVMINALALKNIDSFVGGVGATIGGAGLTGSFSIYSIGNKVTAPDSGIIDTGLQGVVDDVFVMIDDALVHVRDFIDDQVASMSSAITGGLNEYAKLVGGDQAAADAVDGATPATPLANAVDSTETSGGNAAYIDGATVHAGGDVGLTAKEKISTNLDTSYTFNVGVSGGLTLTLAGGLLKNYASAQAYITNGADVTAESDIVLTALSDSGDPAADDPTCSIAGTFAFNISGNTAAAYVDGATVDAGSSLDLDAESSANIKYSALLPGVFPSSLNYKVSLNKADNATLAYIANGADVDVSGPISLTATDTAKINVLALAVGYTTDSVGVGASLAINDISNTTKAYIDSSKVRSATSLTLTATSNPEIFSVVVGAQYADSFSLGASFGMNDIRNTVEAYISGTADFNIPGAITLTATDNPTIQALAGSLGVSSTAGVGAGVAKNYIASNVKAYIDITDNVSLVKEIVASLIDIDASTGATLKAAPEQAPLRWAARSVSTNSTTRSTPTFRETGLSRHPKRSPLMPPTLHSSNPLPGRHPERVRWPLAQR